MRVRSDQGHLGSQGARTKPQAVWRRMMMCLRGTALLTTMFAASIEPVVPVEPDMFRYGLAQGGLLAVVVVLLFYIRQKHQQEIETKNRLLAEKDERLEVFVGLVSDVKTTIGSATEAIKAL